MFADLFRGSDLLFWPMVGFFVFFTTFLGVLVRVFLGRRHQSRMDHVSGLPLQTEFPVARSSKGGSR